MSYIGNQPVYQAFVTDQFSGNGSNTSFTMSVAPANTASVLVAVSGVLQDPSTYSVSGTTLTFSAAPPSGTGNISARYLGIPVSGVTTTAYRTVTEFTATAGQTVFTPPSYVAGFLDVYRNGVKLAAADFTATNGTTVTLTTAATAGDIVTTVSFQVSSVINAIPATAGAVNNTYLATGAVQQTNLAAGVAGTGPAFSGYSTTAQTLPNTGAWTKIQINVKEFDTANSFDFSTNYRFTPNVAGYYLVTAQIRTGNQSSPSVLAVSIYKNGTAFKANTTPTNGSNGTETQVVALVQLNGTTDYIEMYAQNGGSTNTQTQSAIAVTGDSTFFQAFLARSA